MPKLHTKIVTFLLIIFSFNLCYSQLTLEDIFLNRKYESETLNDISFFNHKSGYFRLNNNHISVYNTKSQKTDSVLLKNIWKEKDLPLPEFESAYSSKTDKYFLLKTNEQRLYRRAGASYYYFTDGKSFITKIDNDKISFPAFSENDKQIAFVKDNNLYTYNTETQTTSQLTRDGKWNQIINGKSDWVYEEEFELTGTFKWCSGNSKIAYLKFNETEVKEYNYPVYSGQIYPANFSYKYPKAGEQNSKVTAHYYDFKKHKNYKINLSNFSYEYIPQIFTSDNSLYFMLLNRHQDTLQIVAYNFAAKQLKLVFTDVSKEYVEVPQYFKVLKDNSFITTSERDGYNHLYHFNENGELLKQLTKGAYEITDVYGAHEKNKQIYFQSNEGNVTETSLFSLNYETSERKQLSNRNGKNTARFSNDYSGFIHTFSNTVTPANISLVLTDNNTSMLLENNLNLKTKLVNTPTKEFLKIKINGFELNAWMIRPKDFNETKEYPLLMFVYGGPNEQHVINEWQPSRDLFYNYLAEQGVIVACVDNRGTNGRGTAFKHSTFLNLGKLETEDQVDAAKYFGDLSFIDKSRIGIFGWSYGGYLSLLTILQKDSPFKTAVAVAPVTNWRFYDNIYTERYMHTPSENPKGYSQYNPVAMANNLKGNLLLIHSTADDNVHFQNSIEFVKALNEYHKLYNFYIYPDKAHSISGSASRYDVFLKITEFLKEKL
jgi:dipeptidyl-peptidase-4